MRVSNVSTVNPASTSNTTINHTTHIVSNHLAEARTAPPCEAALPAVNDKHPMESAQLTRSKREPCMRCIRGGDRHEPSAFAKISGEDRT